MHKRFINFAIEAAMKESLKSNCRKSLHGCVAVISKGPRRGQVLYKNHNYITPRIKKKSMMISDRECQTNHAEVSVIHKIPKNMKNRVIIVVIRTCSGNILSNSRPCTNCEMTIKQRKLSILYS